MLRGWQPITALALLLTLIVGVSIAQAGKGVTTYFGNVSGTSSAPGGLNQPRDIAVNSTGEGSADAGDIYVANTNNNRIEVYDADYEFKFNFGSTGVGAGMLSAPTGIAIDQADGSVYVYEQNNRRVSKFSAAGGFLFAFGAGVADNPSPGPQTDALQTCTATCFAGLNSTADGGFGNSTVFPTLEVIPEGAPDAGDVIVTDPGAATNRRIQRISAPGNSGPASFEDKVGGAQGTGDTEFGNNSPNRVAIDDAGFVYVVDVGNNRVQRFDADLDFDTTFAAAELSGAPAPTDIAIDPGATSAGDATDDRILVVKPCTAVLCPDATLATERRIKELDTSGALQETHMDHAGIGVVQGIGTDIDSDRIYVSSTTGAHRVYVLDDTVAPDAVLDPIASFDAHSATFTGTVDPNGALTGWRFEYVEDDEFQVNGFANATKIPTADASAGYGDSPLDVERTALHLKASTTYHVRLVAKQSFGADADVGGPLSFTTDSTAPHILGAKATVGITDATLRGSFNPENEGTDYYFEWGADSSYGSSTPVQSVPPGTNPVTISEDLSGLTPGQTYHFRLVAENGTGETLGDDVTFTVPSEAPQPGPDRAYEAVSPLPIHGVPYTSTSGGQGVTIDPSGKNINFRMLTPLQGGITDDQSPIEGAVLGTTLWWPYSSTRTEQGWKTREVRASRNAVGGSSADVSSYLVVTTNGLDPDDQNGAADVYLRRGDGSLAWVSRDPRIPQGTPQTSAGEAVTAFLSEGQPGNPFLVGSTMSKDGNAVVFSSKRQLDDSDTSPAGFWRLYKWRDGDLQFVGRRADGSVPTVGSFSVGTTMGVPSSGAGGLPTTRVVSPDGSRVIYSAIPSNSHVGGASYTLYIQTDGEPTADVVKPNGMPPLQVGASQTSQEPYNVTFRGASVDGSRVFFTSASRLTPDSGAAGAYDGSTDLYVYDIEADEVRTLTPRLDGQGGPSSAPPAFADQGRAFGVVAVSEDGKHVYFVSDARYDTAPSPTGDLPAASGRNLYVAELDDWGDPIKLSFVTSLGAGDADVWAANWRLRKAYSSPDGRVLGFGSDQTLTGEATGGTRQMFVYDADSHSLECASCPSGGGTPAGEVNGSLNDLTLNEPEWQSQVEKRWVAPDGSVYFHTPTPLLDADRNDVVDVYEYRSGQLRLISAGTGNKQSGLQNVSADGSTVAFMTSDALVPEDQEPGLPKLYVAKVGGGDFVNSEPPLPDCEGGDCREKTEREPDEEDPGSSGFEGKGNNPKPAPNDCTAPRRRVKQSNQQLKQLRKQRRQVTGKRVKRLDKKVKQAERKSKAAKRQLNRCARESS